MRIRITENYPGLGNVALAIVDCGGYSQEMMKALIRSEWDSFKSGEPDSDSQFYKWLEDRNYDVSEPEEMEELVLA